MDVVVFKTANDSNVHLPLDAERCSIDDNISPRDIASLDDIIQISNKKSMHISLQFKKVVILKFNWIMEWC